MDTLEPNSPKKNLPRTTPRRYDSDGQGNLPLFFHNQIWRTEQVAEYLGLSKGHIYNLTSDEKIPFHKKGKVLYFIPSEIENWILEGNIQ